MKLKYDTWTTEGKIAVMQRWLREPNGALACNKRNKIWFDIVLPEWDWSQFDYNYPASTKLVPWTMATVPNKTKGGLWVRWKKTTNEYLVTEVHEVGIPIGGQIRTYDYFFENFEHTTDGGKNWLPCGTEVEG